MKALELQQAVFTRLSGFSGLSSLITAVLDDVPPDVADSNFPFVVIGDDTEIPFNTHSSVGGEHTITIHTWSRYRGRSEVKQIQAQVYAALNRFALSVTGAVTVNCEQEFDASFLDPDGITRHGVQRFRVLLDG